MCATKNLVCVPIAAAEQQNQDHTILLRISSLLLNQPSLERDFSFPEYPCREEFQAHSALARLQALAAQFPVLASWVRCP